MFDFIQYRLLMKNCQLECTGSGVRCHWHLPTESAKSQLLAFIKETLANGPANGFLLYRPLEPIHHWQGGVQKTVGLLTLAGQLALGANRALAGQLSIGRATMARAAIPPLAGKTSL